MPGSLVILAQADDSSMTKIITAAVFLLIWAVSGILSHIAKKKEQERRRHARDQIQHGGATPPPLPKGAPKPGERRAPPVRPVPLRVQAPPKKPAVRMPRQPARRAEPPPAPPLAQPAYVTASAPTPSVNRQPVTVTAVALNTWLRPATLRQQFILTEILQPPVGLRDGSR